VRARPSISRRARPLCGEAGHGHRRTGGSRSSATPAPARPSPSTPPATPGTTPVSASVAPPSPPGPLASSRPARASRARPSPSLLHRPRLRPSPGSPALKYWSLDEAGMVGTRQLHRLVDHTTRAGAKLVLVGDPEAARRDRSRRPVRLTRPAPRPRRAHREPPPHRPDPARHRQRASRRPHRPGPPPPGPERLAHRRPQRRPRARPHGRGLVPQPRLRPSRRHVGPAPLRRRRPQPARPGPPHRQRSPRPRRRSTPTIIELRVGDRVLALRNDRKVGVVNGTTRHRHQSGPRRRPHRNQRR
jgi:hypothetical protein